MPFLRALPVVSKENYRKALLRCARSCTCTSMAFKNNFGAGKMLLNKSLFPIHHPHLFTASFKSSTIPYSSIIFQFFLQTVQVKYCQSGKVFSSHSACYHLGTDSHLYYFCNMKDQGSYKLKMLLGLLLWLY